MNKTIQNQVPEGKTNLVAVDKVDNRPVTERIKTFEDAVRATGMKLPLDDNQLSCLPKDVVAYMKLRIIAAALNELNEYTLDEFPKFTIDEWKWYPMFGLYTKAEIGIKMLKNKKYTCFTSMNEAFGGEYVDTYVVKDGKIITARSAAASIDFAFKIMEVIKGKEVEEKIKKQIYY